jgi:plasmid stabilization system protein ParE
MDIVWSKLAQNDYWSNIEYLEKEWSVKEVYHFMDKTDEVLEILKTGKYSFRRTNYLNTFQVPVVPQVTLFYRIEKNTIVLLRFWNNFQDLSRLSL